MNFTWPDAPQPYCKDRTAILYTVENGYAAVAFGYRAQQLFITEKYPNALFYKDFKLMLDRNCPQRTVLAKGLTVERLIADYLRYMKNQAVNAIEPNNEASVLLFLRYGQIMRKVLCVKLASMLGIIDRLDSERLVLCLEPEAAGIYAKQHNPALYKENDVVTICDAGGGTVDLITFRVGRDQKLLEVVKGVGIFAGSTFVDENFVKLVKSRFGSIVWDLIKPEDRIVIQKEWERVKREFNGTKEQLSNLNYGEITLPRTVVRELRAHGKADSDGFLVLTGKQVHDCFEPVVQDIEKILYSHLARGTENKSSSNAIVMAGGFSESRHLVDRIRKRFADLPLVIVAPPFSSALIVQGAVIFSIEPDAVESRVVRITYGIGCQVAYDPQIHQSYESEKIWNEEDQDFKVKGYFSPIVEAGRKLKHDQEVSRTYYPAITGTPLIRIELFATLNPCSSFVSDPSYFKMAFLEVEIPEEFILVNRHRNPIEVSLQFGRTEIKIASTHVKSKTKCQTTISFTPQNALCDQ